MPSIRAATGDRLRSFNACVDGDKVLFGAPRSVSIRRFFYLLPTLRRMLARIVRRPGLSTASYAYAAAETRQRYVLYLLRLTRLVRRFWRDSIAPLARSITAAEAPYFIAPGRCGATCPNSPPDTQGSRAAYSTLLHPQRK
jgi:hypothetical protein